MGEWDEAYERLAARDASGLMAVHDLPGLADAAYAAGHLDVTIEMWERIHSAFVEAGDPVMAAGAAARVAMHLLFDTALMAPVRGWLARAERLLDGHPSTPAHAWCAVIRCYERLLIGDLDGAGPWAQRAIDLGVEHDDAACAIGRVAMARLLVLEGDVADGLALLDEVGVTAVSGDLDALSTGVVYCELVCAFQGLAQYDLAEQWTEAMERWCRTNAVGSLHGRCRVHRAEILRLRGSCGDAEAEVLAACDELQPYLRRELGWPLGELGQIRLRVGDVAGAEVAFLAAHHAGWESEPGLSLVRLAEGDVAGARESIREALDQPRRFPSKERPPASGLHRAPLLEAQVEIAAAAGDLECAVAAADELEAIAVRYESKPLAASAASSRGRACLAAGDAAGAMVGLTRAVRLWNEIGAPYEEARTRLCLADALRATGADRQATLEGESGRRALEQIATGRPDRGHREPTVSSEVFRREGDVWLIVFDGQTVRIRDLTGLRYLARLMAEPGRERHVLDLVGHGGAGARDAVTGDSGPLLDAQAKAAYKRRLDEIDADIAEAESLGDLARAAQADAEREFLIGELSRAFGLGGRDRRAGAASERARVAVTRAVRAAMRRIADHHESLGAHLDHAIRTGTYCAYEPDPRATVDWEL